MASKRFLGFLYPVIAQGPASPVFPQISDVLTIRSDLIQLILTNPGERVMQPNFGCGLRKLLFEPGNNDVVISARSLLTNAISTYEPRITVKSLDVKITQQNVLSISLVYFDPNKIDKIDTLQLDLPIGNQ